MSTEETKNVCPETEQLTAEQIKQRNIEHRKSHLIPLKPYDQMTEAERERAKEIRRKAGEATKAVYEKRRSMNEAAKALLNAKVSKEKAKQLLGDDLQLFGDSELTVADILNGSLVQAVTIDRNVKAYEALRDTAGYAPKKEVEISADIMTDNDRLLLENIKNRLAIVQNDGKPTDRISG